MKSIFFSRHAKRQMKWRKISEEEIYDAIFTPEKVEDSIKGRKNAYKHIKQKWLKITYKEDNDQIAVVTAIDKNQ